MSLSIWVINNFLRLSLVMMVASCEWLRPSHGLHPQTAKESTIHHSSMTNSAGLSVPYCDGKIPSYEWFHLAEARYSSSSDNIKLQLSWQALKPYKFAPKAPFRLKLKIEGHGNHQGHLVAATPESITFESSDWPKLPAAHISQTDHRLQTEVSYELTAFVCEASHQCFMKTASGKLCPK